MEPTVVSLIGMSGSLTGKVFTFEELTTCILGRAEDCYPRLPNTWEYRDVSRHHCLLGINPPEVRIQDLASLNGTFVNGQRIGPAEPLTLAGRARYQLATSKSYRLKDGDVITLGAHAVFRVSVQPSSRKSAHDSGEQQTEPVLRPQDRVPLAR